MIVHMIVPYLSVMCHHLRLSYSHSKLSTRDDNIVEVSSTPISMSMCSVVSSFSVSKFSLSSGATTVESELYHHELSFDPPVSVLVVMSVV